MLNHLSHRRQFERVPISLQVNGKYVPKIFRSHFFEGQSLNLSYDGLCIQTKSNGFKTGQNVKFGTRLYKGDFLLKAKGKICWVNSNFESPESINIGIKLIKTRHYNLWCKRVDEALSITKS